jgi:hypothetical protein
MKKTLLILAALLGLGILSEIGRDVWEYFHPRYEMNTLKRGKHE